LIKNKGLGLDLQEIVTEARTKLDLPESDDEDMETDSDIPTPPTSGAYPHLGGTRPVIKGGKSPHTSPLLQSRLPVMSSVLTEVPGSSSEKERSTQLYLHAAEPSPTTESNQAPSLIDDDEDLEMHSPTSSSTSEQGEDGEVDFHVQDEDDSQQVALPRNDFQSTCAQPTDTERPTKRVRRPSALRRQAEGREEKHVSFVSPSPALETPSPEGKRRKIAK
jgi:hypothetical protein